MSGYSVARLDEIDEITDGRCPWRPVRHHFAITSFGVNAWTGRDAAVGGTPGQAYEPHGYDVWPPLKPLYEAGDYAAVADRGRESIEASRYPTPLSGYAQPSCLRLIASFQIFVMCRIRSPSKSMT